MSHDRGCHCGRERWEYADCPWKNCRKQKPIYSPSINHQPQTVTVETDWAMQEPRAASKQECCWFKQADRDGIYHCAVCEDSHDVRIAPLTDAPCGLKRKVAEQVRAAGFEVPPDPSDDAVVRPEHYTRFKIEPILFIMENNLPFWLGNIVKYVMRWDAKDGLQDLKKARRYLDMRIKQIEGDPKWSE